MIRIGIRLTQSILLLTDTMSRESVGDGCYYHIRYSLGQPASARLPVLQVGGHSSLSNG